MPYFIRRYNEKENTLLDLFKAHKEEAVQLTLMLENYKVKFDKLLDHMSSKHSTRRSKRSVIHSIFNSYLDLKTIVKPFNKSKATLKY